MLMMGDNDDGGSGGRRRASASPLCWQVAACFGACYCTDLLCTIPIMRHIEAGHDAWSVRLFAFYEVCWPCMGCLACVMGTPLERVREIRASLWPLSPFPPSDDDDDDDAGAPVTTQH